MSTPTIEHAGEVVTHSLVRYFDLPAVDAGEQHGQSTFALITLDNGMDHSRPTTLGPAGLRSLAAAIAEIAAHSPAVVGVGITGKPFVFAVGADLKGIGAVVTHADALAIARAGHETFAALRDMDVPTFAFINGPAMGGGLELALHCDYRTLSAAAGAVSFPEVFLGLVPGWGGSQLLPNLIGPAGAVEVILANPLKSNTQIRPVRAAELGIVDVILPPADFVADSVRWAAAVLAGSVIPQRRQIDRGAEWDAAMSAGQAIVDARVHAAAPAPYRALKLLELARTASFADGSAAEDEALADLIMSDELRSSLYAFDLVNRRAKRPAGAPDASLARPVTKVGVVGAGLMASQLAALFVHRLQVPVVLTDVDAERLAVGIARVHLDIDTQLTKKRINSDTANRLKALVTGTTSMADFADADFVIEAVYEQTSVKKAVFAELERHLAPTALLATNTSSLSVSELAADLVHPERVVGVHFFNPVAVLPLVEIVRADRTDDASLATAFSVAKTLKKSAVLVADTRGFVVNRLLLRLMSSVIETVDEGTPIEVADAALVPLGMPMSTFELLGLVGPAVALHVNETLHASFGARFPVSENLRRMVAEGKPGVYTGNGRDHQLDPDVVGSFVVGHTPSTAEQVRERVLVALAEEIAAMLHEHVTVDVTAIDLCMLLGAGWPFHLGGIVPYLDRQGISERVSGSKFLPPGVARIS